MSVLYLLSGTVRSLFVRFVPVRNKQGSTPFKSDSVLNLLILYSYSLLSVQVVNYNPVTFSDFVVVGYRLS